jgi:hypothetical protein
MLSWIKDLLFFPDRFFLQSDKETVNLVPPAVIVGLSGLAGAAFLVGETRFYDPLMLLIISFSLLWMILMPFISWGIYTVIFYYLGTWFSGSGTLERTAQNTGYGLLPSTLLGLVILCGSAIVMYDPGTFSSFVPGYGTPALTWYFAVGGIVLSLVSLFWSGYIWTYGLSHAHAILPAKAALMVALVVLLSALLIVWPPILNAMMMSMYTVG